jgi:protein-S-isoprenylcysteine O-methyltransferase Ste14
MRTAAFAVATVLIVIAFFFFVPVLRDEPWTPLRIAGVIIAVIGFALLITARVNLGTSFSFRAQPKGPLVTHGLYSKIRNPIYVFVDVTLAGVILAVNLPWALALVALIAIAHLRQAGKEAKALQEQFGQAYLDYRKKTWF